VSNFGGQEKKLAMQKWGRELKRILAGEQATGKVVSINSVERSA
jgi:hypothetical protein